MKMDNAHTVTPIDDRLELFVDDTLIDRLKGATLRMHTPVQMPLPRSPFTGAYMTVIKDGDLYRGYYRRYKPDYDGELSDGNPGECTCCVESTDGIEWTEPELGVRAKCDCGGLGNVLCNEPPFAHNFSPFIDTRPGIRGDERWKALAGKRGSGLYAFVSGDGIQWKKTSEKPMMQYTPERHGNNAFDSQNVAFWSEVEQCYVCYFRHWKTPVGGPRSIARATSDDFLNWNDESASFRPPNLPGEELYTSQTHPYFRAPHIYIALPTRFTRGFVRGYPVKDEEGNLLNEGSTDIMLMSSRAGENFYRRPFKEAFIRPGPDPQRWENRANYVALNVVPTGPTEMSIYNRSGHRYVLRTDGFASVSAPFEGGEMVTKPLTFKGEKLVLNLSTAIQGGVRAELQDGRGTPLPGFSVEDCEPIIGDRLEHVVSWEKGSDVSEYAGTPVRVRFELQDSDIFSLRFC